MKNFQYSEVLLVIIFSLSKKGKNKNFTVRKPNYEDSISVKEHYIHAKVLSYNILFLP